MYATGGRFVAVGYRLDMYAREDLGELDPLVRNTHYEAAVDTAERFIDAVDEAYLLGAHPHSEGWFKALDFIAKKVQRGRVAKR